MNAYRSAGEARYVAVSEQDRGIGQDFCSCFESKSFDLSEVWCTKREADGDWLLGNVPN